MAKFITSLQECKKEDAGLILFSTFITKGRIEENDIENIPTKSIYYNFSLSKTEAQLVDNFYLDILNRLKMKNLDIKLQHDEGNLTTVDQINFTTITLMFGIDPKNSNDYLNALINNEFHPSYVKTLIDKNCMVFYNSAIIGVKNIQNAEELFTQESINILCNGEFENFDHNHENNTWIKYEVVRH